MERNRMVVPPRARFRALPAAAVSLAPTGLSLAALVFLLAWSSAAPAHAQAPFLAYDFEDGDLGDFFNPNGLQAIDVCGDIAPAGIAKVEDGEVVLANDAFYGIAVLALQPEKVAEAFPAASRDYTVRLRVQMRDVLEVSLLVRLRIGIREANNQADAALERTYSVSLFAQGTDASLPDGFLGIGELTACHDLVEHPEWPGGLATGFARAAPGFPIGPDDWYWVEASVQGDDDGGPVLIAAKVWPDGEAEPEGHLLIVVDEDGLPHTAETLDPATECQIGTANSLDAGQQPSASSAIDDLSLTEIVGCEEPPILASRKLWGDAILAEGAEAVLYEPGATYEVRIELSDPRGAGACPAPGGARVVEVVPPGWTVEAASDGGDIQERTIVWDLAGPLAAKALTYTVAAGSDGLARFLGEVVEKDASRIFLVEGQSLALTESSLPPVSDFGTIQHWLILGPFTRKVPGANPGAAEIAKDYLTDGDVRETEIQPRAGDQIVPDYGGAAAATGLAPNSLGRNPGGIPTWVEWRDFDDADDRIDFEAVYGDLSDVMCYALTYLNVLEDTTVSLGVSSDDSVQVLLDGGSIHANNVARGALGRSYQDTPSAFPKLGNIQLAAGLHVLLVKVFEGGGEHNFRVGFLDEFGLEIPGGPPEIEILLEPPSEPPKPEFRRGDPNDDGKMDIADAVFGLNWLFLGGPTPSCIDAADTNDDGEVNISDPISLLNFLFLGGPSPPPPMPDCGEDPTEDELRDCAYAHC
ncbi:MAG: dockerin type I repeat-containing protein [Planctomycetota bacterium]